MERAKSKLPNALVVTFILCILGAASVGAAGLAEVTIGENNILFQPHGTAGGYQLVVSGPSGVMEHHFTAGQTPSLSVFNKAGNPLADGSYTWELRALQTPGPEQRAAMNRVDGNERGLVHQPKAEAQWGYLLVQGGVFVVNAEQEEANEAAQSKPVQRDQQILDDLIVDGSACIGQDCVNGESFGFDTLRLKENNLRIKAQDTSNSASFPSNDWQITFNDSGNGGANKYSIDDIDGGRTPFTIEASAPSHSLYVDDGGRVGLGKSTPVVELHITNGDTPTVRLEQDGSSGFTAQTWDLAGNETNFFVRDATNGSKLPFKIVPDAPTNSLFVANDGDIGLGTASPDAALHSLGAILIEPDGDTGVAPTRPLEIRSTAQLGAQIEFNDGTIYRVGGGSADNFIINSVTGTGTEFSLDAGGNLTISGAFITPMMTYADHVFEEGYPLMPLDKLASFIEEKGHLPNIPSRSEAERTGVNMSQLQIKLLEKVEELTLYTLQHQQTIRQQQEIIEELQNRLGMETGDK